MASDDPPLGSRFSHVYIERREPIQDSTRMRRRIAAQIYEFKKLAENLGTEVRREIGIDVPYPTRWPDFLEEVALRDLLDLITIAYRLLRRDRYADPAGWLSAVRRILEEENVHYRVDDHGGVHFYFDQDFAINHAAAIQALQGTRYTNALDAFEKGMSALREVPPNGKGAIRGIFSAAESVFRLMVPTAPRLGAAELDRLAAPLDRVYSQDDTARRSAAKMLASLKDWVDAVHFYRHEEGAEQIAQPPLKLGVYIVSTGASHLRWLAEVDTTLQQAGD